MARNNNNSLLALANVLMSFSELVTNGLSNIERIGYRNQIEIQNRLRAEGIYLKNQLTAEKIKTETHRTAVTANRVVEGDQKIEKLELELKILREKVRVLGIDKAPFVAIGYPDPGDVRRGILPPEGTHAK